MELLVGVSSIPVTLRGTPREILVQLIEAKKVTTMRKDEGWFLYQPDENWTYTPFAWDERLCPVCESFAGPWNGTQIPAQLPDTNSEHPLQRLANNERYPNTHVTFPYLKGQCRCLLHFDNYLRTLAERLMSEIEVMIL